MAQAIRSSETGAEWRGFSQQPLSQTRPGVILMDEEGKKTLDPTARLVTPLFLVGFSYLLFATFPPYFSALIWSAVLLYGLYPQYCRIVELTRDRRSLSALVMSVAVTIGLVLPLGYLSFLIGKELARTC